ncbi:hypothetical protein N5S76_05220 [Aliarcobacter cryaerophilus]|jgi:hypothetical protein|uniref:hypothetical protein n=1 Tax=Aliarcobacter cryaerophilus TaxID=28198 RepID=UPI0021B6A120|nr:hypothetical protein [Aliarcobacter cryaerophilus]MCT7499177.1 hypothetical protein [Aliarcobacter cryaerophilus]
MTGKILGFDATTNIGSISGDNGQRYAFSKEDWKEISLPAKDQKVDFAVNEEDKAIEIYTIRDNSLENTNTLFGLIAIGITFFFGFIGTFISRIVLAKQSSGQALIPTLIHFAITLLLFIPILGAIIYIIGTAYFMYKNYLLTTNK